jgi:N-carbamoylputrescine amidase
MQGHAAANIVPLLASNRIGTEQGEKYTMTF